MAKRTLHLQCELLEAAKKYPDNLAVEMCIRNIEYLKRRAESAKACLSLQYDIASEALQGVREFHQLDILEASAANLNKEFYALQNEFANVRKINRCNGMHVLPKIRQKRRVQNMAD